MRAGFMPASKASLDSTPEHAPLSSKGGAQRWGAMSWSVSKLTSYNDSALRNVVVCKQAYQPQRLCTAQCRGL